MVTSRRSYKGVAALVLTAALGLAGCSNNPAESETSAGPPLVIYAGSSTPMVANFNPYSPNVLPGSLGMVYQTLYYYNRAVPVDPEPLLATDSEWADDGLSLTISLREGVTWNDGEPLTADDLAFSFTNDAVKDDYISGAEVVDDNTVKLSFNEPAFSNEYAILGATYIVPEHVFSQQSDLVTFTNEEAPVGTGAFMLDAATDAAYTLKKNPNYWEEGKPTIDAVQYIGIESNASAESLMQSGQIDYMTVFVPDPTTLTGAPNAGYLKSSSPNPIVILTCSNAELGCKGAQTDKAVRQAFSLSLDRGVINEKAYYGLSDPGSPSFTKPGRDDDWVGEGNPKEVALDADVPAAKKVLEDAGYTQGSDGIYAKDGVRASFTLGAVEGWSDATAAAELMVSQAKEAGIEVKTEALTDDQYSERRSVGNYEMIVSALFGTPISDPYTLYRNSFSGPYTQPVGTPLGSGQTNFARYSNAEVDQAIANAAKTNDVETKKAEYAIVQRNIVEDLPYIPMFHAGGQTFFNQTDFAGWPGESDRYANPASFDGTSVSRVVTSLTYK